MTIIALSWLTIAFGYLLYLRSGRQWGHVACFLGSVLLTWEAMPTIHREQSIAHGRLSAAERQPPSVDGPFIVSVIKSTYHRPDCSYVRLMNAAYVQSVKSREEAEARGCEPCQRCLTALASAPVKRPDNPTESTSGP